MQREQFDAFTLPAGTVCHRNGIPFELAADTAIRCHPENWPAIRDEFVPAVGSQPVEQRCGVAQASTPHPPNRLPAPADTPRHP